MKQSIKKILRKENIYILLLCVFLLQACKPERTTDYKIENKADAPIKIFTSNSDSVYSIATGATQTIFTVSEFVGKYEAVSKNFLLDIDSIKKGDLKYKSRLIETTWLKTADSKNTLVTYKITVNNADF